MLSGTLVQTLLLAIMTVRCDWEKQVEVKIGTLVQTLLYFPSSSMNWLFCGTNSFIHRHRKLAFAWLTHQQLPTCDSDTENTLFGCSSHMMVLILPLRCLAYVQGILFTFYVLSISLLILTRKCTFLLLLQFVIFYVPSVTTCSNHVNILYSKLSYFYGF